MSPRSFTRALKPALLTCLLSLPAAHAVSPPTITFFGYPFEGNVFVWCLDRSASVGDTEFQLMKEQVVAAIDSLTPAEELSLVAFSSNTSVWSSVPLPALDENKASAIAWVNGLTRAGWSCLEDAALSALDILALSGGAERELFIVGDGVPICNGVDTSAEVLANVTAANTFGVHLHTIHLSTDSSGIFLFQALADMNDGIFVDGFLPPFRRGDVNGDGVFEGVTDAIYLLAYLFLAGCPAPPCLDGADANDDGGCEISDVIFLLAYQFIGGSSPPPPPGPDACGDDPTADSLGCLGSPCP